MALNCVCIQCRKDPRKCSAFWLQLSCTVGLCAVFLVWNNAKLLLLLLFVGIFQVQRPRGFCKRWVRKTNCSCCAWFEWPTPARYFAVIRAYREVAGSTLTSICCRVRPCAIHSRTPASVTQQYNLVLVEGRWCSEARKVTVGLVSHWLICIMQFHVSHSVTRHCSMLCCREGNRRSGVALVMGHRLSELLNLFCCSSALFCFFSALLYLQILFIVLKVVLELDVDHIR